MPPSVLLPLALSPEDSRKLCFFLGQLSLDDGTLLRVRCRLKQLPEMFDIRPCDPVRHLKSFVPSTFLWVYSSGKRTGGKLNYISGWSGPYQTVVLRSEVPTEIGKIKINETWPAGERRHAA